MQKYPPFFWAISYEDNDFLSFFFFFVDTCEKEIY